MVTATDYSRLTRQAIADVLNANEIPETVGSRLERIARRLNSHDSWTLADAYDTIRTEALDQCKRGRKPAYRVIESKIAEWYDGDHIYA